MNMAKLILIYCLSVVMNLIVAVLYCYQVSTPSHRAKWQNALFAALLVFGGWVSWLVILMKYGKRN